MKENTFTPLLPDQIEAVEKFLVEQDASFDVITEFREAFSTPPEPEYIPGRWYYFDYKEKEPGIGFGIIRCSNNSNNVIVYYEGYDSNGRLIPNGFNRDTGFISGDFITGVATPEQIQHHLSLAAEKKGFKPGVKIRFKNPLINTVPFTHENPDYIGYRYYPEVGGMVDVLTYSDLILYEAGSWAEIVQEDGKFCECKVEESGYPFMDVNGRCEVCGRKRLSGYVKVEQEEKSVPPKDYVDMSSVTISVYTIDNPSPIIGPTTDDTEQSVPPLPADGKWCILRTPENAEIVNAWANKIKGHVLFENTHSKVYFDGTEPKTYYISVPQGNYPEITDEQFRVHVLGEKTLDEHIKDKKNRKREPDPKIQDALKDVVEKVQEVGKKPKKYTVFDIVNDNLIVHIKDGIENNKFREYVCNVFNVSLISDIYDPETPFLTIYRSGTSISIVRQDSFNDRDSSVISYDQIEWKSYDQMAQPQHDQWEYRSEQTSGKDYFSTLSRMGEEGWEAWNEENVFIKNTNAKDLNDLFLDPECIIKFKRRKK